MKLGIALSGGGIRGIAHAGALKALEENGIKCDIISGTSSGSMIATLYALGYSPYYIYILFKRYAREICELNGMPILSSVGNFIVNKKIKLNGFNNGERLEMAFNELARKQGAEQIGQIKMPLLVTSVDISKSEEVIFSSIEKKEYIGDIPVGTAIRASASFPVVFEPCKYKDKLLIDGGVLDNTPIRILKENGADKVIAIRFDSDPVTLESNVMDITMKTIDIMGNKLCDEQFEMCNHIITIPSDGTGLLDVDKLDFCYKSGYTETMKTINEIRKNLL